MSEDLNQLNNLVNKTTKNISAFRASQSSKRNLAVFERIDRMTNPEKYAGQSAEIVSISKYFKPKYQTPFKFNSLNERTLNALNYLNNVSYSSHIFIKHEFGISDGELMRLINDGLIFFVGKSSISNDSLYQITSLGKETVNELGGN